MIFVLAPPTSCRTFLRRVARITLVLIFSSLTLARTLAQDASPPRMPPPEAIDHYSRGRAHYQAGRYREAVIELEQALALDPGSPNLVYNLARVYELLGRIDPAIANYERYRSMLR
jgi:tetratricopeptide (TPR) repeat protein